MANAPIIYQSTDEGAPQVYYSTLSVNFMNVIKTCLVDGYGSKPPAGWTMPYYNSTTPVYVLRNDQGSGAYLRLAKQDQFRIYVSAWRTCTGTGETDGNVWIPRNVYYQNPTLTSNHIKMSFYSYWYPSTSAPVPWIIFADEKAFWFFSPSRNGDTLNPSINMLFCGDFCSFYNLTWPFALVHSGYYSTTSMSACPFNTGTVINNYYSFIQHTKNHIFMYILDEPHNGYVMCPYIKTTIMDAGNSDFFPHAYPYNGHIFIHRNCFTLYGRPADSNFDVYRDFQYPIGQLPGSPAFLGHCVNEAGQAICGWTPGQIKSYAPSEFWKEVTIDGEQFWMFRTNVAPLLMQPYSGKWRPF